MQVIPLNHNRKAIVCDCHYDLVKDFKWHFSVGKNAGYAERTKNLGAGKFKTFKMHRVVNNTVRGLETDHKNGNKLDNRCSNLRSATKSQNQFNKKLLPTNTSGVKGVSWHKECKKWRADISINGKLLYLGLFENKKDAITVRQEAAYKYHGEFAKI
jgi:hypothetical protein